MPCGSLRRHHGVGTNISEAPHQGATRARSRIGAACKLQITVDAYLLHGIPSLALAAEALRLVDLSGRGAWPLDKQLRAAGRVKQQPLNGQTAQAGPLYVFACLKRSAQVIPACMHLWALGAQMMPVPQIPLRGGQWYMLCAHYSHGYNSRDRAKIEP